MFMEFLDAPHMKGVYYRNHRSNGQKNLRCFPQCSQTHTTNGFCGTSLHVRLTISR